jgi:hypothetical protein
LPVDEALDVLVGEVHHVTFLPEVVRGADQPVEGIDVDAVRPEAEATVRPGSAFAQFGPGTGASSAADRRPSPSASRSQNRATTRARREALHGEGPAAVLP